MRRAAQDHERLMTFGSSCIDDQGQIRLSETGKQRCYRTAEAFFHHRFPRERESLLIAGGYPKELINPPIAREALLMADFLIERCNIPSSAIMVETGSTSSIENFIYSAQEYPEVFEGVMKGEEKLGLISHPRHLARLAFIGSELLPCPKEQLILLPTMQQDGCNNDERAALEAARLQVAQIKASRLVAFPQSSPAHEIAA